MVSTLVELRRRLQDYAGTLDTETMSAEQARAVLGEASTIQKAAADLKGRVAARLADLAATERQRKDVLEELARASGEGVKRAEEAIATQRQLALLPTTAAATRSGELSPEQARAVAAGATADPDAEAHLLDVARTRSVAELNEESARVRAAVDADPEARRRRLFDARSLRTWCDAEGAFHLHFRHTPEAGAVVRSTLVRFADAVRARTRASGKVASADAVDADALVSMAEAAAVPPSLAAAGEPAGGLDPEPDPHPDGADPGGPGTIAERRKDRGHAPTKIIVRVDLGALLRGYPVRGEVCEIVGVGPIAVSAVDDLMSTGDPFLAAVVTKGERLTGAVHLGRRPRALQQTALDWLFPSCAVAGCSARAHLETDHRIDWARSHITVLDLMDRLCGRHHRLKTSKGWALVDGTGKRDFVPPTDPRHPQRQKRPPPRDPKRTAAS